MRPATLPRARRTARPGPRPTRPTRLTRLLLVAALGATGLAAADGPAAAEPMSTPVASTSATTTASAPATTTPRARAGNRPTPGNFTGYGFDQCLAPTQAAMDTWLDHSPFLAVGIYISGDSRACRSQPNLTPAWVRTQLAKGWALLPITLGPQASCQPRFPRYADDFKISPFRGAGRYPRAREMGRNSAKSTVVDAKALGIVPGSTLWYDLEGFDLGNTDCRESALAFISTWTTTVRGLGYVAGVYSSAGSGIKALDDARVQRPKAFALPDRIWIARWDGVANTSTDYIRDDGWRPGGRVKQYRGGHDEVWGGVRINIDSNYLDLGLGSVAPVERHCGGVQISFRHYQTIERSRPGYADRPRQVRALQCLLTEQGFYQGKLDGRYLTPTVRAVRAWKAKRGMAPDGRFFRRDWTSLLSWGNRPVLKIGSAGAFTRRVQRAVNAADIGVEAPADGVYTGVTAGTVRAYQRRVGLAPTGIVTAATWAKLQAGARER